MSAAMPTVQPAESCEPHCAAAVLTAEAGSQNCVEIATAEIANSITHGLGLLLSMAATAVLMYAARHGDFWQQMACGSLCGHDDFGVCYVDAVAPDSTAAAAITFSACWIRAAFTCSLWARLRRLPPAYLREGNWWILLAAMWAIALAGFLSKVVFVHRIDGGIGGCSCAVGLDADAWAGGRCWTYVPAQVVWWVLAGGACYTVGTLFLMSDHRHRYLHAVWHLFVIAGSACHFWAILHYTMPAA